MSTDTTFELPSTYQYGYVKGQVIFSIADTAEDVNDKPQARAAKGKVHFTPTSKGAKVTVADYPAIVINTRSSAILSSSGNILDEEGRQGIWLIEGDYIVSFDLTATSDGHNAKLEAFPITVTPAHTLENPLNLAWAVPPSVPEGATVVTLIVPAGGTAGQVLVRGLGGALEWADAPDSTLDPDGVRAVVQSQLVEGSNITVTPDDETIILSVPVATTSVRGVAELADTSEHLAGIATNLATTPAGVKAMIDALVAAAPGALNTLNELASALGNDASFATNMTNALASRVRTDTAVQGLNSTQKGNARTNMGAAAVAPGVTSVAPLAVVCKWNGTGWVMIDGGAVPTGTDLVRDYRSVDYDTEDVAPPTHYSQLDTWLQQPVVAP